MRRLGAWLAAGAVVLSIVADGVSNAAPESEQRFVKLYNGEDLSGWEAQNGKLSAWKANGDLLSCVGAGGGWLRTAKMYSDFVLRLQYRIPKDGNSGVGLRFPPKGDPAHEGMEIQILDDNADVYQKMHLVAAQHTGGIYYQAAAKQGVAKPPGEWNEYEITCLGPHVIVKLNGQVVNEVMVDQQTKGAGGHKALSERPQVGYVGLQSHDSGGSRFEPIDFRDIELKDLTTATPSGLHYVDLAVGTGPEVPPEATVAAHYTGWLTDGTKFDSSRDRGRPTMPLSRVIPGWQEGIPGMKVGGRRKLIIPPELAYGGRGAGRLIPPNATLVFDVEVVDLKTK